MRSSTFLSFTTAALATVLLSACQSHIPGPTPAHPPANFYNANLPGRQMRRVAMLPIFYDKQSTAFAPEVEAAFQAELSKTSYFEVVRVSRDTMESLFHYRQFSSTEALPADLLAKLATEYGVDGVLFTDVSHYHPYLPIAIGVRATLVSASGGRTNWSCDHFFDAGNPSVAEGARRFAAVEVKRDYPLDMDASAVLQSPSRFARYVASEMFSTLGSAQIN